MALAWLIVALLKPGDVADTGCQLSFLAVAVLYWGIGHWSHPPADPLQRLVEESRPVWERFLLRIAWRVALGFVMTWIIWLAAAPLVAARYHTVAPVGLLLAPPAVLLASIALITGFLLLLTALVCLPLTPVFAFMTRWCLIGCEYLVDLGDRLPGGHWYVGDVPEWWLWVFYTGLLATLTVAWLRSRWRWVMLAGLAWLCIGLARRAGPAGNR